MGSLGDRMRVALAAADPLAVARRLRLNPVRGATGNAKFRCPFHKNKQVEANLYKKTRGRRAGELGFGCDACQAEVDGGSRERMPDPINLAQHVLGCSAHDATKWLEAVNAGREPVPVTKKPATAAPKAETWESPIKGFKLGRRVFFGEAGAFDEAGGQMHVALTSADLEYMTWYFGDYKGWDLDEVSLVAVDNPAGWIALRTLLPPKVEGQLYYRGEPTKDHMDFLEYAKSKGCAYRLFDLDRLAAKLAKDERLNEEEAQDDAGDEAQEDDQEDDEAEEPVAAPRVSLADKERALQAEIDAIFPAEDPPVRAPTTPIAPSVQVHDLPEPPVIAVKGPSSEPPIRVVTTRQPEAIPASTLHGTPVDVGRPVRPRPTVRLDPVARRQEYEAGAAPRAAALLRELLANGPVAGQEVVKLARDRGISRGQVRAARDALGVTSLFPSACWSLPSPPSR